MYNYLKVLILSILVLLILFAIYMITDIPNSQKILKQKTLKIESIQIEPIKISPVEVSVKNTVKEKSLPLLPIDILSKLKTATEESRTEENILASLKKEVKEQTIKKIVVKKIPIKMKPSKKKIVIQKRYKLKKSKPKIITKVKVNKLQKKTIPIKTIITSKKELPQYKNKPTQKHKRLSREEEVALYTKIYANTLEVVNVSDSFEIQEKDTLPDSYYFETETQKTLKTIENNTPLKFVEKLGVVTVSDKYESNFVVPQKVEVAKEAIVNFSSTSVETKELQRLEFVDTLGVIEISEDFETIHAKKYLD